MEKSILDEEQKHLEFIQGKIKEEIDELDKKIASNESDIRESMHYAATEKLDLVEFVEVKGEIYNRDSSNYLYQQNKNMFQRIMPKPFFAKIQIKERGSEPETFYIGLKNLFKDDSTYLLDWRSPIASLLYFSSLGNTYYTAPVGKIPVELLLKRQFRLQPNKIVSYIDTNTKIDDNILQEILSQNTSSHMTNIVESIQEEQNEIIRKPPMQTVIINGIAGSGKTSVAMHRISYILYANKGNITSKNVLVISPSKLFSTYISDLLPELGEENVRSCTIMQVLKDAGLAPKTCGTKLSMVDSKFYDEVRMAEINTKFSTKFYDEVNEFLKNYDIVSPVYETFKKVGLDMPKTLLYLLNRPTMPNIKQNIEALISAALSARYKQQSGKAIERCKAKMLALMENSISAKEILSNLYAQHNLHFAEKPMGYEDAPIYAYINANLMGVAPNHFIKHIFIDEMQDYDPFSIALIKKIYPSAVMTLTGDYNQNILSSQSNLEILQRLYPNVQVDNLTVSYRSTNDIIEFAQKIVGETANTRFVRKGSKPSISKCKTDEDFVSLANAVAEEHKGEKIAVVVKSFDEAFKLAKLLPSFTFIKNENDDALLTSNNIITTTYLSKGLEYDRVIIPNADESNYHTPLDRQNLYVACTRALHGLYVCYSKKLTSFIQQESKEQEQECSATPSQEEELKTDTHSV